MLKKCLLTCISVCILFLTGCSVDDAKVLMTEVKNNETIQDIASYVKDKGIKLKDDSCQAMQSYIDEHFGDVDITGVSVTTTKSYVVTFTDESGKEQSIEFNSDYTTDLDN